MPDVLSPTIQRLIDQEKLLLIDKPQGLSSHYMVKKIRLEKSIQRVGHCGTLDPLATGLLLILVGRDATVHSDELMGLDKEYEFTAELGYETDTYDCKGTITQSWPWEVINKISQEQLQKVLKTFIGEYDQQVPAYSAVKLHGRKLYELALQHQQFERPTRPVKIFSLELLDFHRDQKKQTLSFSCRTHCGSGTYIRSLAVDIGKALGVSATITALRRTRIGPFSLENPHI